MGYNTKIDWCDTSWNPVTGCYHDCEYCYARGIANRFGGYQIDPVGDSVSICAGANDLKVVEIAHPVSKVDKTCAVRVAPYPFSFAPTLHRYRLDEPSKWTQPRNIFVCSMADLFGAWVPDEWIKSVFDACLAAPQHRYLFLTKNPARYLDLKRKGIMPDAINFWFGSTTVTPETEFFWGNFANIFVSIEPILAPFTNLVDKGYFPKSNTDWIIVGAETGKRKNKVIPEKSWIMELVQFATETGTPIFMKESLREIMGKDFIQQFPWGDHNHGG